jgi:hypothetical protein
MRRRCQSGRVLMQTVPGATLAARGLGFVGDPPHPANK